MTLRDLHDRRIGTALVALAIGFNLPYARLAVVFDYPSVLRQPSEQILAAFSAAGAPLIMTWYAFALMALLFLPVGMAHALGSGRIARQPAMAVAAAVAAALAGLTQAMGLLRWVLVVPQLANTGDVAGFELLHAYAGMAVGEHLGQLLTALHVGLVAAMQGHEGRRGLSALGAVTALTVTAGAFEGVALAIGLSGAAFGLATTAGYLLLTVWMIASGIAIIRRRTMAAMQA
jgi:Domain of unknown function (DUF4386)